MIALAVLIPLIWAALVLLPGRTGGLACRLLPLASLPALAAALLPPAAQSWPWLLLGLGLAPDPLGRALLLLIGLAWSAAAWFAAERLRDARPRFALFWCLCLAGLCQSALAADLAGFYLGYVAMTLAAYGLVVHNGSGEALRAGRVYLVMAFLGEALVLSGVLLLGARHGNLALAGLPGLLAGAPQPLAGGLLLAGFAVKMGLVPLHLWLPVAHPVAPVPASAILSGVIVKAGLLGALRLVPGEAFGAVPPVALLMGIGLATAFYGVAAGLGQGRLKTVLAYSTVSQMGLIACALALSLGDRAVQALLALLILHHGLNKAALFLAAGCSPGASRARLGLLALPALALAAAPLTSGALAKTGLKAAADAAALPGAVGLLLALSSAATALLMLHLGRLALAEQGQARPVHPAWPLLVLLGLAVPWLLAGPLGLAALPDAATLREGLWPLLAAGALYGVWWRLRRPRLAIPEGDLLAPVSALLGFIVATLGRIPTPALPRLPADLPQRLAPALQRAERSLATLPVAGLLVLGLVLVMRWVLG